MRVDVVISSSMSASRSISAGIADDRKWPVAPVRRATCKPPLATSTSSCVAAIGQRHERSHPAISSPSRTAALERYVVDRSEKVGARTALSD